MYTTHEVVSSIVKDMHRLDDSILAHFPVDISKEVLEFALLFLRGSVCSRQRETHGHGRVRPHVGHEQGARRRVNHVLPGALDPVPAGTRLHIERAEDLVLLRAAVARVVVSPALVLLPGRAAAAARLVPAGWGAAPHGWERWGGALHTQ